MYENKTYNSILQEKLALVSDTMDKREGSIIYDAMAPNSVESAQIYLALDAVLSETFADTASYGYLVKRCAERGIKPHPATAAVGVGEMNIDVPIGARFSCDKYNWYVSERIAQGKFYLTCETLGSDPNRYTGTMTPIQYIDGLSTAAITSIAINGEDKEEEHSLRARYIGSFANQSYGFNRAQYIEVVSALPGVGGVKPYRAWNGGGTVKLVITDSGYGVPSQMLVDTVQTIMDPTQNSGEGLGLAAIDHEVTVVGVRGKAVDIASTLTYAGDFSYESCLPYIQAAIDEYFAELSAAWGDSSALIVRIAHIETRLLALDGIIDVFDTTLNGIATNLELEGDEIPIRGEVSV